MIRDLRDLTRADEGADRHQTPVPWGQSRTKPEVAEEHVRGVLHNPRSDGTEVLLNAGGALRLGRFIERKRFARGRRELFGCDSAFLEDVLRPRPPTSHCPSRSRTRDG